MVPLIAPHQVSEGQHRWANSISALSAASVAQPTAEVHPLRASWSVAEQTPIRGAGVTETHCMQSSRDTLGFFCFYGAAGSVIDLRKSIYLC